MMVRSLVKRSSSMRPADFTQLFAALGMFGVHPGNQMLSELLGQLPRQLQRFNATELCSVFWGLGLIVSVEAEHCKPPGRAPQAHVPGHA